MDDSYYLELVLRDAESIITQSEQESLAAWLAESESNVRKAEEIRALWFSSMDEAELPNIDRSGDYQKIINRIRGKNRYRPLFRILSVAAVGLLILAGIFFLMFPGGYSASSLMFTGPLTNHRLPDASKVWLSEGSTLRYVAEDQRRKLDLSGRAYFAVYPDSILPFVITTKVGTVEVLGTAFEVWANADSMLVEVANGLVKVKSGSREVVLERGRFAAVTGGEILVDTLVNPVATWRLSPIEFRAATLREVMDTIQTYYPMELTVRNPKMWECRLTFTLRFPSAEELLILLEAILEVSIEKRAQNEFVILGEGCE